MILQELKVDQNPTESQIVLQGSVPEQINRRKNRKNYAVIIGIAVGSGLFSTTQSWLLALFVGLLTSAMFSLYHRWSKRSTLIYGDSPAVHQRLAKAQSAVRALWSSSAVWAVEEASYGNGLTPCPRVLRRAVIEGRDVRLPSFLRSNITPASVTLADRTLFFFPDRLLVSHSGKVSGVNYQDLRVQFQRIVFLEREMYAPEAAIKGRMRLTKSGNDTAPLVYYGLVELSGPGLEAGLMTTSVASAAEFTSQIQLLIGTDLVCSTERQDEVVYTTFSERVPLFYDLPAVDESRLQQIKEAFLAIQNCEYVWSYANEPTDDWKRNAGAGTVVIRSVAQPKLVEKSPDFESNCILGISFGCQTLFLLPDGFVLGSGQKYRSLGTRVNLSHNTMQFRDDEFYPKDAELVGHTWRYVNKAGGPDRRFVENRQVPIFRYGTLELRFNGWGIKLCMSRATAAKEFAEALHSALRSQNEIGASD